jgi:hypothetical protein
VAASIFLARPSVFLGRHDKSQQPLSSSCGANS